MTSPTAEQIRERHDQLLGRLRAIAEAGGHDPRRLRIVGVTKTHPIEVARAALEAGIEILGENRVQEAEPKVAALPGAEWHLIGHLQTNKARRAVQAFTTIHSVDSQALLDRLDALAVEEATDLRLLLQVNVSGEAAKAGLAPDNVASIRPPQHAALVGLMTIAPMGATPDDARAVFRGLREVRDQLEERIGQGLPELSMGMSADADAAAAEGATLVRIGSALFGPRA